MKVNLINKFKELWKASLSQELPDGWIYKYENLSNYRRHWDLSELDLKKMYADSFSSQVSGRLWGGTVDSPRSIMMSFIDINKEFVRSMFRDLHNESKDLSMRINRFSFHCDQLLELLQKEMIRLIDIFMRHRRWPFCICVLKIQSYILYTTIKLITNLCRCLRPVLSLNHSK